MNLGIRKVKGRGERMVERRGDEARGGKSERRAKEREGREEKGMVQRMNRGGEANFPQGDHQKMITAVIQSQKNQNQVMILNQYRLSGNSMATHA